MQRRVRQRFHDLQLLEKSVPWCIVNAAQPIEQVEGDIWNIVKETMDNIVDQGKPLRTMWHDGSYDLTQMKLENKEN
jgi:hypothetical protein